MAAVLTGKSWRDFLDKNSHLPAAFDREHAAHDTGTPISINLKSVTGLKNPLDHSNPEYGVCVSLYDITYRQFFGRQWVGPVVQARTSKLQYNKNLYFHTSITNANIVVVFEVVTHTVAPNGRPQRVSSGWGFLHPFSYESADMPDSSRGIQPKTQKLQMYHGSPRALFFMDEPLESNKLIVPVESCELNCTIMSHKPLLRIMHLLPENTLVDANDIIPGMADMQGGDKFKKPKVQKQVPIVIEGLNIQLQPNVDKFEEELCSLMAEDRSLRESKTQDSMHVSIVERRLQVGVHNGWCYVEKPSTFQLDVQSGSVSKKPTASPSARRSSRYHIRRNSTGSSSAESSSSSILVLKNRVQIQELMEDPMCAIVFTLEYVIGEPLSPQARRMSVIRAHSRTISIRWATWTPLLHPNTSEITMALVGGAIRSPDDALVYKIPTTSMQDQHLAMAAGGLLAFRWCREGEGSMTGQYSLAVPSYPGIGSAGSLRSDPSEGMLWETGAGAAGDTIAKKPPAGKHSPRSPRSNLSVGFHPQQRPQMARAVTDPHAAAMCDCFLGFWF